LLVVRHFVFMIFMAFYYIFHLLILILYKVYMNIFYQFFHRMS